MLFSICIAVYNAKEYLKESINSILQQDFSDYEIILVDDASTDGSGALCDQVAYDHPGIVRVVHHEKNKGLLLARRTFFNVAEGDWFIAVDADDVLMEGALCLLSEAIQKTDADLILYDLDCFHFDGHVEHFTVPLEDGHDYLGTERNLVYQQIYKNNYINSMCTKAIRRDLIDFDVNYDVWQGLRFGTDIFQSYPILDRAQHIIYIKKPLYHYIKRNNAITTKWHSEWYDIRKMLWDRERIYRDKWKLGDHVDQEACVSYLKGTVAYLDRQFLETPVYQQMDLWYKRLTDDGDIANCLKNAGRAGLRYRVYANLIVNKRYRVLFVVQRAFQIAVRLMRK